MMKVYRRVMQRVRRWKVLKSYGTKRGVWWGIGWQDKITWPVQRSWLYTVLPPYLRGSGLSFAFYHLSFRVGVFKRVSEHEMFSEHEDIDGELKVLAWGSGSELVDGIAYDPGKLDKNAWKPEPMVKTYIKPSQPMKPYVPAE